ncbi:hypothetical protein WICMUC_003660 [Wickerhamomyces mucosus]|uniref:Uncharacterized protein n=1 Tax=Wickerhamomyces mucosus TaxID=1378264 RepID=A0A9P8PJZ1_9ASCO|nr:hypothetical protein WICMUC_003660 [Wickerhamomyces mucosus]
MNTLKGIEKPKSKKVIKPILDSPYLKQEIPEISNEASLSILQFLLHYLKDTSSYLKSSKKSIQNEPEVLKYLTLGFNSTVQKLENQVKLQIQGQQEHTTEFTKYLFICQKDIKPQLILSQFPTLVYMSSSESFKVKLISLPKGSLDQIEQLIGSKTSIIGMSSNEIISKDFKELLENVPDVDIPWLKNVEFKNTRVKLLETTQPLVKRVKQPIKKKNKNKKGKDFKS